MNPVSESAESTESDGSTVARKAIDATVAELSEGTDLDHRELADALLESRDTLMVTGRVPDWFGAVDAPEYGETVRD